MPILRKVTRALGNCRSVQLSYGAFGSAQRKSTDFGNHPHTIPTPASTVDEQTHSAFCVIRPPSSFSPITSAPAALATSVTSRNARITARLRAVDVAMHAAVTLCLCCGREDHADRESQGNSNQSGENRFAHRRSITAHPSSRNCPAFQVGLSFLPAHSTTSMATTGHSAASR